MSYKLNEQRITPGGLDLLVPSDQNPRRAALTDLVNVPQGECLDLTDWFAGSDGRLEQAPQPGLLSSTSPTGQNSLCQVSSAGANRLYFSDGSKLCQVGRASEAPINTDYDGYPLGMLSYQGYLWIMNQAKQRRDNGIASSDWTVSAPTNLATPTSAVPTLPATGSKKVDWWDTYYVTWVTDALGETNPSPSASAGSGSGSHGTNLDSYANTITQPTGAPPEATGWNVYRNVPAYTSDNPDVAATPYLVNPNPIPVTTATFVDTGNPSDGFDDTSLLLLGTIMEADHDKPPKASIMCNQVYNGRIVVGNSADHPNRIWWTPPLQPAFFPGSGDDYDGNWADIGTDSGDEIRAIIARPGFLAIYRAKSIWVLIGDCGDSASVIQVAVPEMGVVGPRAVVSTAANDHFVSTDGVYTFNNDVPGKASFKVDPLFRGLATENFPLFATASMGPCAIGHRNGRLWVSYPSTTSSGTPVGSLVLHIPSGRWFAASTGYGAFLDVGTTFLGAAAGVFNVESGYLGTGRLAFQSQYHDCGLPDRLKTWGDLVLSHNTQGATLTIICRIDKNADAGAAHPVDSFTLATISSTALTKQVIPLVYPTGYYVSALVGKPIKSFNLSIRITGPGASGTQPAVVESPMLLHYYIEARQGMTWDSGITNHGLEGVGVIDQVEIDFDASLGGPTLNISSDVPGGVMALRTGNLGLLVGPTSGRQVLRVVLTDPVVGIGKTIYGRLFRHQLIGGSGVFGVYGYKVRIVPLGVYADGSQADYWHTLPIAPGEQGAQ